MNRNILSKLSIDLVMTMLMLAAMAYRITGNTAHELIGASIVILFIAHNLVNRRWYQTLLKGKYNGFRMLNAAVNLLLLVAMAALIVSGVLMSRTVFAFLPIRGGMLARQIHILAVYWLFILVSLHVGLHWGTVINAAKTMVGIVGSNHIRTGMLRVLVILIAIFGVYASLERDIGSKLILYYTYEYWDANMPALIFFTEYLSIMGLYICGAYYVLKYVQRSKNAKVSNREN